MFKAMTSRISSQRKKPLVKEKNATILEKQIFFFLTIVVTKNVIGFNQYHVLIR